MFTHQRAGQGTVEFILMLSLLSAIGITIMLYMTNQGTDAIGTGQKTAVTAIQND